MISKDISQEISVKLAHGCWWRFEPNSWHNTETSITYSSKDYVVHWMFEEEDGDMWGFDMPLNIVKELRDYLITYPDSINQSIFFKVDSNIFVDDDDEQESLESYLEMSVYKQIEKIFKQDQYVLSIDILKPNDKEESLDLIDSLKFIIGGNEDKKYLETFLDYILHIADGWLVL